MNIICNIYALDGAMIKRKFKYNLNHRISLTPRHLALDTISLHLALKHDIPEMVFGHDRFIPEGSPEAIPFSRLRRYAAFFNCSVLDLRNTAFLRIRTFLRDRSPVHYLLRIRPTDKRVV